MFLRSISTTVGGRLIPQHPAGLACRAVHRFLVAILGLMIMAVSCGESRPPPDAGPLEVGRFIYGESCSVCHGLRGEGGVGQELFDVLATFPDCGEHLKWIELGS